METAENDADVQVDWNADTLELVCKTAVGCITPSSEGRLSTGVLLPRLHRAIILNAGRSGVVLGGDIDDDVTAMLSPIKFGERDSAITFNARDNYVVPGEALNNLVNNLSLINDGQSYAVRELVDDLMVSARSMNSGEGSSDRDGAGHWVPCSACNKRPFVVKCEGESHSLCALCIDIAVLKGPNAPLTISNSRARWASARAGHLQKAIFISTFMAMHGTAGGLTTIGYVSPKSIMAEKVGVRY
ncbi:hypothetical protein MHU86_13837 [Fragilaria crotonensis]|nr:hypothetical protein MHU86_13837 [Fragilaria crotonensis]